MTARVDFYLLKNGDAKSRSQFGCRITQKAWSAGHKVFVQVSTDRAAVEMDQLLWTFNQQSFIPHAVFGSPESSHAAVVIGTDPDSAHDRDLLVSLVDHLSAATVKFSRVVEIVEATDQARSSARQRFRQYRDQGIEPNTHKL